MPWERDPLEKLASENELTVLSIMDFGYQWILFVISTN